MQQIESEHGVFGAALTVADSAIGKEEDSIAKADLFGEHLISTDFIGGAPFDPSQDNPFASYLRKLTDDLDIPGVVNVKRDDLSFGSPLKFPGYDICLDELDHIANKSTNAKRALETGYARLSEVPEELMAEDIGEEREKWLEDRLPNIYRDLKERDPANILADTQAMSLRGDEMKELWEKVDSRRINSETEKGGNGR